MSVDVTCLYSTVKNVSGSTRRFGFLPPHGKELDNNEEITVFGNVLEAVYRGDRFGPRHADGLERALGNNDTNTQYLEIVNTPAPILYDETADDTQMLQLDNSTLSVANPCWETSLS